MSSAMTNPDSRGFNLDATFHPSRNDDELSAVEVAGVFVFVYLDPTGTLRVSLDFDTADPDVFGEDSDGAARNVPVQVSLSGHTVYSIDRDGIESYDDTDATDGLRDALTRTS